MIARTPTPPYYAVIFTSTRTEVDKGYRITADHMVELAAQQPGFLGVESARNSPESGGLGITVSYWESLEAIKNWRNQAEHTLARQQGRAEWYTAFETRICQVERAYGFNAAT